MSDEPRITAEQILQVASLIRGGNTDDLAIALQVRIPEEQVARLRAQGLGCPLKKKSPRRRR